MPLQDYCYLTKIQPWYIPGKNMRASLPLPWPTTVEAPELIYLYQHHTYVPYRVQYWHARNQRLLLTLQEPHLLPKGQTAMLPLYVAWKWLSREIEGHPSWEAHAFTSGFTALDKQHKVVGSVVSIEKQHTLPLCWVADEEGKMAYTIDQSIPKPIDFVRQTVVVVAV